MEDNLTSADPQSYATTRFLFYKQHFYKQWQRYAEICQFSKPILENIENRTLKPLSNDCSNSIFVRNGKANSLSNI